MESKPDLLKKQDLIYKILDTQAIQNAEKVVAAHARLARHAGMVFRAEDGVRSAGLWPA